MPTTRCEHADHSQPGAGGSIAPTVLMPGDPLRADYIAHRYLKDAVLLSRVRGIPVYTGLSGA